MMKDTTMFLPPAGSSDLPQRYTWLNRLLHGWRLSLCSLVHHRPLGFLREKSVQMFLLGLKQPSDCNNIFNFLPGETLGPLQAPRLEKSKQRVVVFIVKWLMKVYLM